MMGHEVELEIGSSTETDTTSALLGVKWIAATNKLAVSLVTEDGLLIRFQVPVGVALAPWLAAGGQK